jgi:hypothetical protein
MTGRLGHKQTAAMLTLMVLARKVSNPELRTIVGFVIDGKERLELNKLGLVTSSKVGRPYVHELTDKGWAWCGDELAAGTPPPPAPRSTLASAMYIVLGGMNEYLRRENLRPADMFAPYVPPEEIESRIRVAYRKLAPSPNEWVGLVDLRPMLGDAPRKAVDAVLKDLSSTNQVELVPESNRKALTAADHAAAIRIGGDDNHLISIETS